MNRQDFPILSQNKHIYLDSAASALKPQSVIDALTDYYTNYSANIHRGLYGLSEKASEMYEGTRETVQHFINAPSPDEIIFTRGATESINLVADAFAKDILDPGDEIVTTILEHHANFVPWQHVSDETTAQLKVIDCDDNGSLDIYGKDGEVDLKDIVSKDTWLLAIQHVSNVLGTVQPLKNIISAAREINPKIVVLVDAAQSAPHVAIDVQEIDCDFLVFSGHKVCGPTGIGVLWGRKRFLDAMHPYQLGGDMIDEVTLAGTTFADPPHRFEAGTPHIAGVIGLKAALEYLQDIGLENIANHEKKLADMCMSEMESMFKDDIHILCSDVREETTGIVAFELRECHPHDLAGFLGENNVAVRAGHHCAQPLHDRLGVSASTRFSMYLYNTEEDVAFALSKLKEAYSLFKKS